MMRDFFVTMSSTLSLLRAWAVPIVFWDRRWNIVSRAIWRHSLCGSKHLLLPRWRRSLRHSNQRCLIHCLRIQATTDHTISLSNVFVQIWFGCICWQQYYILHRYNQNSTWPVTSRHDTYNMPCVSGSYPDMPIANSCHFIRKLLIRFRLPSLWNASIVFRR